MASSFWQRMQDERKRIQGEEKGAPTSRRVAKNSPPKRTQYGSRPKVSDDAYHPMMAGQQVPGMYLGRSTYPGDNRKLFISLEEVMRHVFVAGQTGNGKTTALVHMMLSLLQMSLQDPRQGPGFAFIDPHGDAVKLIMRNIPPELADRVHVLHFRDTDRPRAFNFLDVDNVNDAIQSVSTFVTLIRSQFAGQTGNRSDYYMRNGMLSLALAGTVGHPETILSFERLFKDTDFRLSISSIIQDPKLKAFWAEGGEFESQEGQIEQVIAPILQKMGPFDTYAPIRNVIGQAKSTIQFREWMDSGQIMMLDLSGMAPDVQGILGAMLVTRFHYAAMSRRDQELDDRRPFVLLCDEIAGFASDTMADILSEDRKYRLGLVLATQYLKRIPDTVLDGLDGNTGTWYMLGLAAKDAERIARSFPEGVTSRDLANLPQYQAVVRTSDKLKRKVIFSVKFDKEPDGDAKMLGWLNEQSDRVDGRPLAEVEHEIARIFNARIMASQARADEKASKKKRNRPVDFEEDDAPRGTRGTKKTRFQFTPAEKDQLVNPFLHTDTSTTDETFSPWPDADRVMIQTDVDTHVVDVEVVTKPDLD